MGGGGPNGNHQRCSQRTACGKAGPRGALVGSVNDKARILMHGHHGRAAVVHPRQDNAGAPPVQRPQAEPGRVRLTYGLKPRCTAGMVSTRDRAPLPFRTTRSLNGPSASRLRIRPKSPARGWGPAAPPRAIPNRERGCGPPTLRVERGPRRRPWRTGLGGSAQDSQAVAVVDGHELVDGPDLRLDGFAVDVALVP